MMRLDLFAAIFLGGAIAGFVGAWLVWLIVWPTW
jgi:hypothetical protein